ncbi:cytochrome P450 [Patulibacter defluvii]|uniref:cytochrome P450 n=1 Tax=Patulibacter defluvii TaxID=3095358 RepID=UPI002A752B07|nr:cytochrome P450 [Patulibacter sp. DM4]
MTPTEPSCPAAPAAARCPVDHGAAAAPPAAVRPSLPPGPRGWPGVGALPLLLRDIYRAPERLRDRYGDVVRVPVPGRAELILVNDPDLVVEVFNRRASDYGKGEMNYALFSSERHLPLPVSDGEPWKRMRRLLSPKFGARQLEAVSPLVGQAIEERIERWGAHVGSGRPVDLDGPWSDLTMSVLLRSMFTTRLDDRTIDEAVVAFRTFAYYAAFKMIATNAPRGLPLPYQRRGERAIRWIHAFLDRMVRERRAAPLPDGGSDILQMLLDVRDDDGRPMTDEELRSELFGLIFGGFETTASALSWTVAMLDLHPDVAATLDDEIAALGDGPPTAADLDRLPYLHAVFDEAQRLQGGPMFSRTPIEDTELGGHRVPRGSIVWISPYALHRDPRHWRDPERFDPARFARDEIHKGAFLPFGLGPRKCMGMRLAYMEAAFALVTARRRYRFRLAPGFVPRHQFHISTGMKGGCPVTLHPPRAARLSGG